MQIHERRFPLKCPQNECKQDVVYADLQEILFDVDLEFYNKYTFSNYIDMNQDDVSWCPTANCEFAFILDRFTTNFYC